MEKIFSKIPVHIRKWLSVLADILLPVVTLAGCFFALEYSIVAAQSSIWVHLSEFDVRIGLLNLLTLGTILSVILILSNRVWLSCLLTSVICGMIAVINYYVIQFHGMPLSFLLIKNFKTAMNVITSYQIDLNVYVIKILIVTAVLVGLSLLVWCIRGNLRYSKKATWIRNVLLAVSCVAVFYWGYFSGNPVKPAKTVNWSWQEAYHQYGYVPCTLETFIRSVNVVSKPETYSEAHIRQIPLAEENPEQVYDNPDIILILNESFYDLRQITDLQEDAPFLSGIENLENALTGYAVVPNSGGGTNVSEYELLTSNSMQLMPGVTPFNALDLSDANSIVSYLEALGYSTIGSHCMVSSNYSRGVGYDALGFDASYFDGDFTVWDSIPGRVYNSDRANYENLLQWYNAMPEEQSRFLYLLTIQNHGDWNQAPAETDTVHALADYGDYDGIVDEYLTCIDYSDKAFLYLTEQLAAVDRPVIVCMVGDHSTNFAASVADPQLSDDDRALLLRKVPLVIWANFALEERDLGTMSMNFVVPTLLEAGNVERSAYYDYMLKLKQQIPVVSSFGKYFDTEGNPYAYNSGENLLFETLVEDYFCLEYHNIQGKSHRELYAPRSGNQ